MCRGFNLERSLLGQAGGGNIKPIFHTAGKPDSVCIFGAVPFGGKLFCSVLYVSVQCSRPSDKKSSRPYITDSEVKLWLVEFASMLQFL